MIFGPKNEGENLFVGDLFVYILDDETTTTTTAQTNTQRDKAAD